MLNDQSVALMMATISNSQGKKNNEAIFISDEVSPPSLSSLPEMRSSSAIKLNITKTAMMARIARVNHRSLPETLRLYGSDTGFTTSLPCILPNIHHVSWCGKLFPENTCGYRILVCCMYICKYKADCKDLCQYKYVVPVSCT